MVNFQYLSNNLELPSPKLLDEEAIDLHTKFKRMMNGQIYSYVLLDPTSQLTLQFDEVNRPKIIEVITFLNQSAGQVVAYTDYKNAVHNCYIINDPFESTHVGPRNNSFELVLEIV